jgi:hypothetical protein
MKKLRPFTRSECRRNPRLGRCYELSGSYVTWHRDYLLVHGTIQGAGYPPNPHAWVILPDGQVHDPVTDLTLPAEVYVRVFGAIEQVRYTYIEMARHVLRTEHWGPWHDENQERSA